MKKVLIAILSVITALCAVFFIACDGEDAHFHFYKWTTTKEATCTEDGENTGICDCGDIKIEIIVASHTEVIDQAVAPTCKNTGLTEGKHCSVCGTILVEQKIVETLEHELLHHDGKAPTCIDKGYKAYETCKNCDYTTYEELPALKHDYVDGECTRCGDIEVVNKDGFLFVTEKGVHYLIGYEGVETNLTLPNGYKGQQYNIKELAFDGNRNLTRIIIPDNVISIGERAFRSCINLADISIGNGITDIGEGAFRSCSNLTDIIIGKSLTNIGVRCFADCFSITSITIPDSVTSIGAWAFDGCSSLTSITIPDSVTSIGEDAFHDCPIKYATIPAVACSYINNKILEKVEITSGNRIEDTAFRGGLSITSVIIPNTVTYIGNYSFANCFALTKIIIPDSVKSMGDYVFAGCNSLENIKIGSGVESIGVCAFSRCSTLANIVIPDNVVSLGESIFEYDDNLTSLTMPFVGIVPEIKNSNRLNYYLKREIDNINDSVLGVETITITKFIGEYAFYNCILTNIIIGDDVTSIGKEAFYKSRNLTSLVMPNGIINIDYAAFLYCDSLMNINIPSTVTTIGKSAFHGCNSLTSINIPDSVTDIGSYAFYDCSSLESVYIGNNIKILQEYAFYNCSSLTKLVIPSNVKVIRKDAFRYCSALTNITMSDNIINIQEYAFCNCSSLTDINYSGTKAQWKEISKGTNWKYDVPTNCKVYCTDGPINI